MRRIIVLSDEEIDALKNDIEVDLGYVSTNDRVLLCSEKCFDEMRKDRNYKYREVEE